MTAINYDVFLKTILAELRSAWESLLRKHPNERFYSFGLYTTELADYLMVTASTEEGLEEATKRYVEKSGGDPALHRACLRWSPCDSPIHMEGEDLLPNSSVLRREGPDPYDDTPDAEETIVTIFEAAVEALRQLDSQRIFGVGPDREGLVLGIWKGDQSNEERIEFASLLNPEAVAERFAREVAEGTRAFFALTS